MTGHVLDQAQLGVPDRSADSFQALLRSTVLHVGELRSRSYPAMSRGMSIFPLADLRAGRQADRTEDQVRSSFLEQTLMQAGEERE
jgi:hypothetical protein